MGSLRLLLAILFAGMLFSVKAQTTYSWSAYPTRCTGIGVYTQPNMTVNVTGSGFSNRGPQCAASACAATSGNRYVSPKYVTSPNSSSPEWQATGLGIGVDWANTSTTVTVAITFTTPVCGPLSFTLYDINSGTWGGYLPVWRDRVTLSGTNDVGAAIYPTGITSCSGNTISGANLNIINAATNTGCTAGFQTITFSSSTIKTLTIVYSSLGLDPTYGTDPDPQYIIISNITTTSCGPLPVIMESIQMECEDQKPSLNWKLTEKANGESFLIQKSDNGVDFRPAGRVSSHAAKGRQSFSWNDPDGNTSNTYYRLDQVDANGETTTLKVLAAPSECISALELSLYPVPASDHLEFDAVSTSDEAIHYGLYDATGKQLAAWEGITGHGSAEVSNLRPGIYMVKVSQGANTLVKRFTVER